MKNINLQAVNIELSARNQTIEELICKNIMNNAGQMIDIELLMYLRQQKKHQEQCIVWMWQILHDERILIEEKVRFYKGICCLCHQAIHPKVWWLIETQFHFLAGIYQYMRQNKIEPTQFAFVVTQPLLY